MVDGEDNLDPAKYISHGSGIDDPYLIRLMINFYASNEICSIFVENSANVQFSMRSLIYIKKHLKVY